MTKFRTVKQNGKKQVIPISEGKTTQISREIPSNQVNKMGIRNPGSLTDLGYRMKEPWPERKEAINAAIKKYGKKKTALKFSANTPSLEVEFTGINKPSSCIACERRPRNSPQI